jgi:phospholipid/cholesterol/gamma-HCH transport system ATP-binding protein
VLSNGRVVVADTIDRVEQHDEEWVRQCFLGPRGRSAARQAELVGPTASRPA